MASGYSLHIGLNQVDPDHYDGWNGVLRGCINDAHDMEAIAKTLGYKESTVLLNEQATSAEVIRSVIGLAGKLAAGDTLFVSYSGHGGQIPDESSDEDDGYDETWCLFDRQLIDDEIYRLLGRFKTGVRIVVVSDSCHSGSVTRDMIEKAGGLSEADLTKKLAAFSADIGGDESEKDVIPRLAPFDKTEAAYNMHKGLYLALQSASAGAESAPLAAGVILLSGCMDNQTSMDGRRNGVFTTKLKKVWNDGGFNGGYNLFHQTIVTLMPPTQVPNLFRVGQVTSDFINQKPFSI